ncbi:MAG TPA: family 78 glycoside hydrolase catalytic domain, partial [Verrucomicrobiae bacterium]|nr:family 78 glycoside hydrolase catalytic domain [Verrucomicrobiae bacterium]
MRIDRRTLLAGASVGAAVSAGVGEAHARGARLIAVDLRTDFVDRPLGHDNARPRLSWRVESDAVGARQSAYRIEVAASEADLRGGALLWDSGRVESDETIDRLYEGPALSSRQRCYWRVSVWDAAGQMTTSAASWWEMGLLERGDWSAAWVAVQDAETDADLAAGMQWIEGATPALSRKFRLRFDLPDGIASAELLITGKDFLDVVFVNGAFTFENDDAPIWGTMRSLDVSAHAKAGANTLAAEVRIDPTSIPPSPPYLAALLKVRLHDGRVLRFASNADWKTSDDAGPDWSNADFDDSAWPAARPLRGWSLNPPWPALPAKLLRKEFAAPKRIASARLYISALGAYEAYINGARVGDAHLAPESTDFRRRALYQIHDVTALVRRGDNAIGLMLGDGFYASGFGWASNRYTFGGPPNRAMAQLEIIYTDGEHTRIVTDTSWKASLAPIVTSEIYNGEIYDARLEQDGWSAAGFDDAAWSDVRAIETRIPVLKAQTSPPIRAMEEIRPNLTEPAPGVFVYDMGQNFSGWARLRVRGPRGAKVKLRFAEVLAEDGNIDVRNLRGARATDEYILKGGRTETYEPHFTYHGFRYVELTGYPGRPPRDAITGIVAYSASQITGALRLENPLIDSVWRNSVWSQKSNLFGVPTDCPQRDERLGWMGDAQVFWNAAVYTMNVDAFTRRFLGDARIGMSDDGSFPDVVPFAIVWDGAPGWANAGVILPHTLYRQYGDLGVIDENWNAMERWLTHIANANPNHLWQNKRGIDYGDWLAPDARAPRESPTPKEMLGTAFWANDAQLMAEMAAASGRADAATRYAALFETIKAAFNAAYVSADGVVGNGTQTSYAIALRFNLLPDALRAQAGQRLADDVR